MGAPSKGEDAKRQVVTFRITQSQAALLDEARNGMSRGEWCRRQIVKTITPVAGLLVIPDELEVDAEGLTRDWPNAPRVMTRSEYETLEDRIIRGEEQ